jgi:hypothetical protein
MVDKKNSSKFSKRKLRQLAKKKSSKVVQRKSSSKNKSKDTIRVKTFIVEKPVYVPLNYSGGKSPGSNFSRRISNILKKTIGAFPKKKKFFGNRNDSADENERSIYDEPTEEELELENNSNANSEDEFDAGEIEKKDSFNKDVGENSADENEVDALNSGGEAVDDLGADDDLAADDSMAGDLQGGDLQGGELDSLDADSDLDSGVGKTHVRSRGLFVNVWWKKALLYSAILWVVFYLLAQVMKIANLVDFDLNRNWVFFLLGLIFVIGIYFFITMQGWKELQKKE